MKLEIKGDKKNPYLKRRELVAEIDHDKEATPSMAAVQQLAAKQLNADVAHVEVRNIYTGTGLAKSASQIFIWDEKKVEDLSQKPKEETKEQPAAEPKEAAAETAEAKDGG